MDATYFVQVCVFTNNVTIVSRGTIVFLMRESCRNVGSSLSVGRGNTIDTANNDWCKYHGWHEAVLTSKCLPAAVLWTLPSQIPGHFHPEIVRNPGS